MKEDPNMTPRAVLPGELHDEKCMEPPFTFDFNSTLNDHPWRVKIILPGDAYGRENCLTAEHLFVEFWDRERAGQPYRNQEGCWPDDGQFVQRYYLSTILQHKAGVGLDLLTYVPTWKLSAADIKKVDNWLSTCVEEITPLLSEVQLRELISQILSARRYQ